MMVKGYHFDANTPLFYLVNSLFIPYFALVLMCHECLVDLGKPLKLMVFAFSIYCILGFFFMGIVHDDNDSLMSLGNMLAINGSLLVFLLCAARNEKVISGFLFSTLMILVLLMIVASATRKAFGVAIILVAFYGVSMVSLNAKNIFLVALLAVGVYVGVNYVMDNTYMGERLANTSEQAESRESLASDSKFLQFVGDRAPHYVLGWEIFKQYPVTGIGLYNFMHVSRFNERLHTDYMVQFTENGLIGVVLFVLYYLWYIRNLNKLRRVPERRSAAIIGMGWIVAVLFLGISAWTYDMPNVFICSGVVASYVYSYKKQ
jgi:O-antigen ligase